MLLIQLKPGKAAPGFKSGRVMACPGLSWLVLACPAGGGCKPGYAPRHEQTL